MKTLFTILLFVSLGRYSVAQSQVVQVDFEVDGKPADYKNAIVRFASGIDTISTNIEDKRLSIPESVYKKRVTVIFSIDKYVLTFDSIPVTLNNLSPKWTVGVDKKPFDKKKLWMIKSWKKVKIVYYLNNDDGRMFTVDGCKKSDVIMK